MDEKKSYALSILWIPTVYSLTPLNTHPCTLLPPVLKCPVECNNIIGDRFVNLERSLESSDSTSWRNVCQPSTDCDIFMSVKSILIGSCRSICSYWLFEHSDNYTTSFSRQYLDQVCTLQSYRTEPLIRCYI